MRTPSMHPPRRRTGTSIAAGLVVASALVFAAAPAFAQSDAEVVLTDGSRFEPEQVTVDEGGTVAFRWEGGNTHNVVFDDGPSSETTSDAGVNFERTFDTAGEFDFTCTIHPATMNGTVTVAAADDEPAPAAPTESEPGSGGEDVDADAEGADEDATGGAGDDGVPQPSRIEAGSGGERAAATSWVTAAVVLGILGLAVPAAVVAGRRYAGG